MVSAYLPQGEAAGLLVETKALLAARQMDGYLVGGFLRDCLLGRPSHDLDLAVDGDARDLAQELARLLGGRYVLLDETHQVVARVVLSSGFQIDMATLRDTIVDDLAQRDFTIDALAVHLADLISPTPTIVDPFGGQRDLDAGLLRALGEDSLLADPLRLLRGIRLAAELDFRLEDNTKVWMKRHARRLAQAAPERITSELSTLLDLHRSTPWLRILDDVGLLGAIMPELEATKGTSQPKEHYWDVFHHCLETVAAMEALLGGPAPAWLPSFALAGIPPWPEIKRHLHEEVAGGRTRSILLKLAALLHDVAKPQSKTTERSGRVRFFGHAKEGALVAASIMERLRFSAKETRLMTIMVENHLRPGQLGDDIPTHRAIYRYFRDLDEAALDTLVLGLADHLATRGPGLELEGWREHVDRVDYLLSSYLGTPEVVTPPKLVDGHLIMKRFGLPPGPLIGHLLTLVKEAQAQGEVKTENEALALIGRELSWMR